MKADKWIELARAKKDVGPPTWEFVHTHKEYTFATNQHRVHLVYQHSEGPCEVCKQFERQEDALEPILHQATQAKTHFTVSTAHLVALCKQARAFTENNPENPIRLSVNGCLQASAVNAETGDWASELHDGDSWPTGKRKSPAVIYQKSGPDTFFGLSPKYLLQALSGMPEIVEVSAWMSTWPVS